MIKPTVGRVMWYYKYVPTRTTVHKGPLAAHVCYVHSDRLVNLMVIGEDGVPRPETSVTVVQENEEVPQSSYVRWMPFQIGQAKAQGST